MIDQSPNSFRWTSEDQAGRRAVWSYYVFVGVMSVCSPVLFVGWVGFEGQWTDWLMGILSACGAALVAFALSIPRGVWQVDDDGIEHQPLRGRAKRLSWDQIEAVAWNTRCPKFRASPMTITLGTPYGDRHQMQLLRHFLLGRLSGTFDFSETTPPRFSLVRAAKILAISLVLAGITIGGVLLHFMVLTKLGVSELLGIAWLCLPLIVLFVVAAIHKRRHYPTWRRRSKEAT